MKTKIVFFQILFILTISSCKLLYGSGNQGQYYKPNDFSGNTLWLKADAGIVYTTGNITSWQDQSGSNNHANVTGGTTYPQLNTNSGLFNSKPAIYFTGTGRTFNQASAGSVFAVTFTIISVTYTTGTGLQGIFSIDDGNSRDYQCTNASQYCTMVDNTGGGTLLGNSGAINKPVIFSSLYNGTTKSNYYNGKLMQSGTYTNGTNLSGNLYHIADWAGASLFAGYIAEVIVFNRALNTTEREEVEAYLADKYGISAE